MSVYIKMDSKIMKACESYKINKLSSDDFTMLCDICARDISSLEDSDLRDLLYNARNKYSCIFWYPYEEGEEPEITDEIENETRAEILPYVDKIEKLIIRGNIEGDPITESERAEWWKKEKEREREEFYNLNGYYEDNDSLPA